jgi:hypothetical protein
MNEVIASNEPLQLKKGEICCPKCNKWIAFYENMSLHGRYRLVVCPYPGCETLLHKILSPRYPPGRP